MPASYGFNEMGIYPRLPQMIFDTSRALAVVVLSCLSSYSAAAAQNHAKDLDQILKICEPPGDGQIPVLNWVKRSDWINVKTDVKPAAQGDGVTDDTAAIQVALDHIGERPGDPKVVYFPPGRYRISKTLSITKRNGGMVIGHGRESTLVWNGEENERMFWSNGAARQVFLGLVWDGAGKAGVGIDHDSKTLYETRVLHKHMEFRNFRQAAIRVGHDQKIASAEMMFFNLLFQNNENGVLLLAWNDYNNIFDGVHFLDNGSGIRAEKGNVVVRNTRFERSRKSDLTLSTHSHSVRRVVSEGSHTFIETVAGPAVTGAITVQGCHVAGWKNRDGAIITRLRGPVTVFDCVFAQGPNDNPPIKLAHPRSTTQTAIISNVAAPEARSVIDPGLTGKVEEIPHGRVVGMLQNPRQQFLRNVTRVPERILDTKRDCGAKGTGVHDDTGAVQACIDRARRSANGTLVYFPSGQYLVSSTLDIHGANYRLGGTGFHSQILWSGPPKGDVLRITDADNIWLEYLAVGGPEGVTRVHHTGNGTGAVRYNTVYGWTDKETVPNAFRFDELGAGSITVAEHIDGTQAFGRMTASQVMIGTSISTQMTVEGTPSSSSRLGILSRVSCCANYPLIIRQNQSLVMTDWYNEQSPHLVEIVGAPDTPTGRITLDLKKAESEDPVVMDMSGYRGRVTLSGGFFGREADTTPRRFHLTDNQESTFTVFGSMFRHSRPEFMGERSTQHVLAGNIIDSSTAPGATVPNQAAENTARAIADALDDFRELGQLDLMLNYCIIQQ